MGILDKVNSLVGNSNEKVIKKLDGIVKEINSLESDFQNLSHGEIKEYSAKLKKSVQSGIPLDEILPEAFALVREASVRTLGQRHFDVQLLGGIVLHQGKIAEMRTGEGKTLVSTLPAYLNSLNGKGVHLVTVNDYLAKRDALWMGKIYDYLGVSVAALQHESALAYDSSSNDNKNDEPIRKINRDEAYLADITYGTNSEFGFDYLRDNMVDSLHQRVQRGRAFAIVDEVDNILIDEARTPLIISGPSQQSPNEYLQFARIAPMLVLGTDFSIEEKHKSIAFSDQGISKIESILKLDNLYDPQNYSKVHFVENAVRAQHVYSKNVEYVVKNGEVIIVDEFTGRLMEGRRYSDGLHQAIEAKEKVQVQRESITYATITLQNYFRLYEKLSGMTGTAATEAEEFWKIYKLEVVSIPTNNDVKRIDHTDLIFRDEKSKYSAVIDEISKKIDMGQPVLVGTTDIDKSEKISQMLKKRGIKHEVLNAKHHEREASIVAEAGRPGSVTVATNMAGRGTDIVLGGNPEIADINSERWELDHQKVLDLGGLAIIGTERHEARRIDNQLRGRAGRQGDPGETKFFCALDDDLVKRFGGERIGSIMDWAGMERDVPIENKMISKSIENAQVKVESFHFDQRKHLVDYDDVVNNHRDIIYQQRDKVLSGNILKDQILSQVNKEVDAIVDTNMYGADRSLWDVDHVKAQLQTIFPLNQELLDSEQIFQLDSMEYKNQLIAWVDLMYEKSEATMGPEMCRKLEQNLMLRAIDTNWVQHLTNMDNLRQGIGLQAVGQRDPLVMYKKQGHEFFQNLQERIADDIIHVIFRSLIEQSAKVQGSVMQSVSSVKQSVVKKADSKIGRNEKCPCGSGKKYKRCILDPDCGLKTN
ncbi:MAG: preprotein translocase subunit SecA [SAR202 cluster bacterium]|nr:preprotein translocase subunit SecA [SAR202 cluster bacterium]